MLPGLHRNGHCGFTAGRIRLDVFFSSLPAFGASNFRICQVNQYMPGEAFSLLVQHAVPVEHCSLYNPYLDSLMLKCILEGVSCASELCINFPTVFKPLLQFTLNLQTCFSLALSYFVVSFVCSGGNSGS